MPESWQVGPWRFEPGGLAACGNDVDISQGKVDLTRFQAAVQTTTPDLSAKYLERLESGSDSMRVITKEELSQYVELASLGEDAWETVQRDSEIHIRRYRDRKYFGGVFVKLTGRLPNANAAHAAHCFLNFADRAGWDSQMDNFRVVHRIADNELLYSRLHCPPLTDREFFTYHMLLSHEKRGGLLIYSRSVDAEMSAMPRSGNVRAHQYMMASEIMDDPEGGAFFTTISAVDPRIPFMPKWIMSLMMPSEFRKWVSSVARRCKKLKELGKSVPCEVFFQMAIHANSPESDKIVDSTWADSALPVIDTNDLFHASQNSKVVEEELDVKGLGSEPRSIAGLLFGCRILCDV
mmetsp:Transcript_64702/g.142780  ORF Transcript_64702/g.142780 Transcript_64702/m.142780 type:complete len:350 (+) Transcript_64702:54-1103(+)